MAQLVPLNLRKRQLDKNEMPSKGDRVWLHLVSAELANESDSYEMQERFFKIIAADHEIDRFAGVEWHAPNDQVTPYVTSGPVLFNSKQIYSMLILNRQDKRHPIQRWPRKLRRFYDLYGRHRGLFATILVIVLILVFGGLFFTLLILFRESLRALLQQVPPLAIMIAYGVAQVAAISWVIKKLPEVLPYQWEPPDE